MPRNHAHLKRIANFELIYKPNSVTPPSSSSIEQSWYYLRAKDGSIHVYLSKKSRDSAKSSRGGKSVRASSRVVRDAKHTNSLVKHF